MGILPGNGCLLVVHLVPDLTEPLHPSVELRPLFPRHLLLVGKPRLPGADIAPVVRPGYGTPGQGAAAQPLQVDDDIGGAFQQGLVVGDIEHWSLAGQQEPLQPREGIQVQVVGWLIQQQHVWVIQQQQGQAQLHTLPAGQGGHGPPVVKGVQLQPHLPGAPGQGAGVRLLKGGAGLAELPHRSRQLFRPQLLSQITFSKSIVHDFPRPLHIGLHQG